MRRCCPRGWDSRRKSCAAIFARARMSRCFHIKSNSVSTHQTTPLLSLPSTPTHPSSASAHLTHIKTFTHFTHTHTRHIHTCASVRIITHNHLMAVDGLFDRVSVAAMRPPPAASCCTRAAATIGGRASCICIFTGLRSRCTVL